MKKEIKVFVLGLDGGSWNVISPLINQGKLPTFEKLIKEGTHGKLKSILPPISVPAWKCYFTGKNPGELGIYSFLKFDSNNYEFKVVNSNDFKAIDMADILDLFNKKSVIYKMFSTYPAKKINGVMVTDFPNMKRGTYPYNLYEEIKNEFGEIFHNIAFTTNRVETYKTVVEETKKDFEVIKWLIKRENPDFVHMSVPHTDGAQHFFWKDMLNPDSPHHDYIEKLWIDIDGFIKGLLKFLEGTEENWYFFIMSDHGFTECKYRFNIANWLVKNNYLKLTLKGKVLKFTSGFITLDRAYSIVERLIGFLGGKLKIKKFKWGMQHDLAANISQQIIDFENSKIIPLEGQILYLNQNLFDNTKEREKFISKLITELSNIKRPDGEPLVQQIEDGRKYYSSDSAPDILILPNNVYLYTMPLINELWATPSENKWTGMHDLYGIFFAFGNGIRQGYEINNAEITDIMPTMLHLFRMPIPEDISGKVLMNIFGENNEIRNREPAYTKNYEELRIKKVIGKLKL